MREARLRNPARRRTSHLQRELLRPQFTRQLERYLREPLEPEQPASAQASPSQPAGDTQNLNTPSYSTIESTTALSVSFSGDSFTTTYQPPGADGQPVFSPDFDLYPLDTTSEYNAQQPTPETFTTMTTNNTNGYGYPPYDQGTPDINPGTINTWAQPSSPSAGDWSTQGQYYTNHPSMQAPNNTNTFSTQTWVQQPQPTIDWNSVRLQSVKIRKQNQEWASIDVFYNPQMQLSYLTKGAAAEAGCSLNDLMSFYPGHNGHDWTQDGGLAPAFWVEIEMKSEMRSPGPFWFPRRRENIAIYPLPQYPGTNAGLIMGQKLWENLFSQRGGGTPPASQRFIN